MLFNLNEFLMALSFALEFVEMDILGVPSNHNKRVAYMALKIADHMGLSFDEKHDITALSILHDNGASHHSLHESLYQRGSENIDVLESTKQHCILGERNILEYPFLTDTTNVIKYHHETFNGKGFFKIPKEEIPLKAQILSLADTLDLNYELKEASIIEQKKIKEFVQQQKGKIFFPEVADAFLKIVDNKSFWLNLKDQYIDSALERHVPVHRMNLTFQEIHHITSILSKLIDAKSSYTKRHSQELAEKTAVMGKYYGLEQDHIMKLMIAADLHDIGKLAVPNTILDNPKRLTDEEFEKIKEHPYYTAIVLRRISGFEEIAEWASNHHERLNGSGYPNGLTAEELDTESRLIACLDVYQALTENRPYRRDLSHKEAIEIMRKMGETYLLDKAIIENINQVFGKEIHREAK